MLLMQKGLQPRSERCRSMGMPWMPPFYTLSVDSLARSEVLCETVIFQAADGCVGHVIRAPIRSTLVDRVAFCRMQSADPNLGLSPGRVTQAGVAQGTRVAARVPLTLSYPYRDILLYINFARPVVHLLAARYRPGQPSLRTRVAAPAIPGLSWVSSQLRVH